VTRTLRAQTRPVLPPVGALLLSVAIVGCDFGDVAFFDLPRETELDIVIIVTAGDVETSAVLGWADARVPGALVRLAAADTSRQWSREAVTDEAGTVTFGQVPVGGYTLDVRRLLDEDERQLARPHGVLAFIDATRLTVTTAAATYDVTAAPSRSRSLVISEFRPQSDLTSAGLCCYNRSKFIELYNNADTTVYLDGKVIGKGFNILTDFSPNRPCSMFDHLRIDARGIWTAELARFPGSGSDYPLHPGIAAVVATDAIDHSGLAPSGLDLSRADFEFIGQGDVDNPSVPNMIDIGLRTSQAGLALTSGTVFIAEPLDPSVLDRGHEPDTGREWMRVPAGLVLDVLVPLVQDPVFPLCPQVVHPSFDRAWVESVTEREPTLSLHRRVLMSLPDGRVVLQYTRASAADFTVAPTSPAAGPGN
jgi:hypothetical protein